MPLPEPSPRRHIHNRAVAYRGYLRGDGLWDIEGEMADSKTYDTELERGALPTGEPVHGMKIRVTIDDRMTIHDIVAAMDHTPYGECIQGEDPMRLIIGASMGPGWRQAIEKALGGIQGCTHLRELLFNMATAAYQTVFPYRDRERRQAGTPAVASEEPPYHLGRCIAWDFDGPVVARQYPQFAGWQPIRRSNKRG